MFNDDEDLENSEDYIELLSEEIDSVEDEMSSDDSYDESSDCCDDAPAENGTVYLTDEQISSAIRMHSREADRPVWKFMFGGETLTGRVVSEIGDGKWAFSVLPDNKLKIITSLKLNK